MRKHIISAVKGIFFIAVLLLAVGTARSILVPRYVYQNSEIASTSTMEGFYKMKRDTVDVVVLGSSHLANGIIPQVIYDSSGITCYNLSFEQESPMLSYYLLREALRYQSPQAVIVDLCQAYRYTGDHQINMWGELYRKPMDSMRISQVKRDLVDDLYEKGDIDEKTSYYFPLIRYHSRWKELTEEDFEQLLWKDHYELMGFYPMYYENESGYEPFELTGSREIEPLDPLMREYCLRIGDICSKEGIKLIFMSTPGGEIGEAEHNAFAELAEETGAYLCDMSERSVYERAGITEPEETFFRPDGDEHMNLGAAVKTSEMMGGILKELGVSGHKDQQWEKTREYYIHITEDPEYIKKRP